MTATDTWHLEVDGFSIEGPIRARSYLRALRKGMVEPFMVHLFRQVVKPGMTILDIGAFLGRYTLLAAQQVGPTGRVYAFEPDPVNFSFLVRNITRNALLDRAVALPYAVTERAGVLRFFLDPEEGSGSSLFFHRLREVEETSVASVALDSFLEESVVVDVIKLDVEAGELAALNGMERTLSRGSRHLTMFVECFPRGLWSAGTTPQTLVTRLENLGFDILVIDERRKRVHPITPDANFLRYFSLRARFDIGLHLNLMCVRSLEYPALA